LLADIGILAVLIGLSGFLSLSEMAVVSVNINRIKLKADQGDKKSAQIKEVKENTSGFFSTIQFGNTFIAVFAGAYAGNVFAEPLFNWLVGFWPELNPNILPVIILFMTVFVSYFTIVLGELIPKRIAVAKPMEISRAVIGVISILTFLFMPFVKILSFSTDIVIKILRIKDSEENEVTEEEIRLIMDTRGEQGGIDEAEREMINNIFEFDDKTAGEIITHRTKLVALPADCANDALINAVTNGRFSRIPVYEDNIDNIIGVLYTHDLLEYIVKQEGLPEIDIRAIMRKPYFVHESKKTDELFKQMQKDRLHMSVVVDEYGGTLGIVTMEDLIEEIMGNILDEYDEEERPDIEEIGAGAYLISGALNLTDAANFFKATFPDDEYETLSGFLIGCIGHIPEAGERAEAECGGVVFKVYEVEEKRVKSIIACKIANN